MTEQENVYHSVFAHISLWQIKQSYGSVSVQSSEKVKTVTIIASNVSLHLNQSTSLYFGSALTKGNPYSYTFQRLRSWGQRGNPDIFTSVIHVDKPPTSEHNIRYNFLEFSEVLEIFVGVENR